MLFVPHSPLLKFRVETEGSSIQDINKVRGIVDIISRPKLNPSRYIDMVFPDPLFDVYVSVGKASVQSTYSSLDCRHTEKVDFVLVSVLEYIVLGVGCARPPRPKLGQIISLQCCPSTHC